MNRKIASRAAPLAVALVLAGVAVVVLATAYTYSRSSGLFPVFTGWIFLVLTLLEVGVQVNVLRNPVSVSPHSTGDIGEASADLRSYGGFAWLGMFLAAIYLVGFLAAIPVFVFAFVRFSAQQAWLRSALVALLATAFVYCIFVWLLEYRLFSGTLHGG